MIGGLARLVNDYPAVLRWGRHMNGTFRPRAEPG